MTLNTKLLTDLVTWAAADQAKFDADAEKFQGWGSWNQGIWAKELRNGVCQSAYCMAGQAVVQTDHIILFYGSGTELVYDEHSETYKELDRFAADFCAPAVPDGVDDKGKPKFKPDLERQTTIDRAAEEAIGLEDQESDWLFDGANDLDDVIRIALDIADNHGVTLDLPEEIVALAAPYNRWTYGDE